MPENKLSYDGTLHFQNPFRPTPSIETGVATKVGRIGLPLSTFNIFGK